MNSLNDVVTALSKFASCGYGLSSAAAKHRDGLDKCGHDHNNADRFRLCSWLGRKG